MSGVHIVESGDTLTAIAKKNELSLDDLATWNKITDPDLITIGQKILLSDPAKPEEQIHVVQPGDTVSELAEKFGVTSAEIGDLNKLENIDLIFAGQKLLIPAKNEPESP